MTATPIVSERAAILAEIEKARAKAKRLSRHDPRRDDIDTEVDVLVELWLEAEG